MSLIPITECPKCRTSNAGGQSVCRRCGASLLEDVQYCPQCGSDIGPSAAFCSRCGHRLRNENTEEQGTPQVTVGVPQPVFAASGYGLSLRRVLFMTIVSYGLYLFYWFYLTWKQYRDSTGQEAYPVWHALTLFVPIYGLFRTHAHMRTFRDLMRGKGILTTISAGSAVAAVMVSGAIDWNSFRVGSSGEITQGTAVAVTVLAAISTAIVAWLLLHVQGNLNQYWNHISGGRLTDARIGLGLRSLGYWAG